MSREELAQVIVDAIRQQSEVYIGQIGSDLTIVDTDGFIDFLAVADAVFQLVEKER